MNRETIYAALFAKFASLNNGGDMLFKTTSRRLRHFHDVEAEEQPALFMVQTMESNVQERGKPPRWVLHCDLYIYVRTDACLDQSVVPSQLLNPLIDAIEAALGRDDQSNYAQTLGGLVSRVWIDGNIETSEGNLGDQEIAVIPLSILVP
jgi:hypothetical protein